MRHLIKMILNAPPGLTSELRVSRNEFLLNSTFADFAFKFHGLTKTTNDPVSLVLRVLFIIIIIITIEFILRRTVVTSDA